MKGKKHDKCKPKWELLNLSVIAKVVNVLTFGALKYSPDNWRLVAATPGGRSRYFAACMRHLRAWQSGELIDRESGEPHLAHAICCLYFILWYDMDGEK